MIFSGVVRNTQGSDRRDRVVAVGGVQRVLGETPLDQGHWTIDVDELPLSIVAQLRGSRFAAVSVPVTASSTVDMPQLIGIALVFEDAPLGTWGWMDPIAIDGFSPDLIWALRTHINSVVDLHVGEFPAPATPLTIQAQPGKYRLGAGRMSIRPSIDGTKTVSLSGVIDDATGTSLQVADGAVVLDVVEPATFRLRFTSD